MPITLSILAAVSELKFNRTDVKENTSLLIEGSDTMYHRTANALMDAYSDTLYCDFCDSDIPLDEDGDPPCICPGCGRALNYSGTAGFEGYYLEEWPEE